MRWRHSMILTVLCTDLKVSIRCAITALQSCPSNHVPTPTAQYPLIFHQISKEAKQPTGLNLADLTCRSDTSCYDTTEHFRVLGSYLPMRTSLFNVSFINYNISSGS